MASSDSNSREAEYFSKEKVLIVEGIDDKFFFERLLKEIELRDIQVFPMRGRDNFDSLPDIQLVPGFKDVHKIGIIRDADDDYESSKNSIESKINKLVTSPKKPKEFSTTHPSVAYYILPNNRDKGAMESLCIASQKNNPAMLQVDKFIESVDSDGSIKEKPKNKDKAKAQAYLSIMPEISYGMAFGIVKKYWNLNHEDFKQLIDFLKSV
jgi:hypothetical protein